MASISAATLTPTTIGSTLARRGPAGIASPPLGLPKVMKGRVRCSAEKATSSTPSVGMAPALAAMSLIATSNPAWALVDERMSTEGTGLPLGISNNLLVWVLLGVFGLIWSLYTVYTSTLDEDEDSALSL